MRYGRCWDTNLKEELPLQTVHLPIGTCPRCLRLARTDQSGCSVGQRLGPPDPRRGPELSALQVEEPVPFCAVEEALPRSRVPQIFVSSSRAQMARRFPSPYVPSCFEPVKNRSRCTSAACPSCGMAPQGVLSLQPHSTPEVALLRSPLTAGLPTSAGRCHPSPNPCRVRLLRPHRAPRLLPDFLGNTERSLHSVQKFGECPRVSTLAGE